MAGLTENKALKANNLCDLATIPVKNKRLLILKRLIAALRQTQLPPRRVAPRPASFSTAAILLPPSQPTFIYFMRVL